MNKKIIYNSTIDMSNKRTDVRLRILQSRTIIDDILGYLDDVSHEEKFQRLLLDEQINEITWQSPLLPFLCKG